MTQSKFVRIALWLEDYLLEILEIFICGLGYALIGVFYEHGDRVIFNVKYEVIGFWLVWIVFLCNLIIGYLLIKKNIRRSLLEQKNEELGRKIQELENEIDESYAEYSKSFSEQLAFISKSLNFTANERISVYRHEIDKFIIVGRYSLNPNFTKIRERSYPNDEGFISKAWSSPIGEHYESGLPKYEGKKRTNNYYETVKSKCKITPQRLSLMRMKSRNYYLKTITDNGNLNRIAIIVFESLDESKLAKDRINDVIANETQRITSFVTKMRVEYRNQEYATQLGL